MFAKSVLVIHAHPDDTEAFCAGTLKLLADRGYKIHIATMTAGSMGGVQTNEQETIALRKHEAREAAKVLGAQYTCLDGRDSYLFDSVKLRIATTDLIRKVQAGVVLTHLPTDYHSDHRVTAQIVEIAAMGATLPNVPCSRAPLEVTPLLYHTAPLGFSDPLGGAPIKPDFFVDISSSIDAKMEMLSHHKSQIELMQIMHRMDNFFEEMKNYNIQLGEIIGKQYAEAFWQHLGGGFQREPLLQKTLQDFVLYETEIEHHEKG